MAVKEEDLKGFARVFYANMPFEEKEELAFLLKNIPSDPDSYSRRMWVVSLVTVLSQASKDVIGFLVEDYQSLDEDNFQ